MKLITDNGGHIQPKVHAKTNYFVARYLFSRAFALCLWAAAIPLTTSPEPPWPLAEPSSASSVRFVRMHNELLFYRGVSRDRDRCNPDRAQVSFAALLSSMLACLCLFVCCVRVSACVLIAG